MTCLKRSLAVVLASVSLAGCTAAKLTGRPAFAPLPPEGPPRTVVVEPFFEDAEWVQKTTQVYVNQFSMFGGGLEQIPVTAISSEKPMYAQLAALAAEHQQVLLELQRLRPTWHVLSTGDLPAASGPVTLVRVVLGRGDVVASDRALKSLAFAFGFLLPPLWLYEIWPVNESQHLEGTLQRYDADAAQLRGRLLRYPTQPDFAVDTRGLGGPTVPWATEFQYEEALFAPEPSRLPALEQGVAQRLAAMMVALVEMDPNQPVRPPPQTAR